MTTHPDPQDPTTRLPVPTRVVPVQPTQASTPAAPTQAPAPGAYGTPTPGAYGTPTGPASYQAPAYAPYPAVPMVPRTNGLAIASLITGLCGLAIVPVILGHMGLGQIRRTGESGTALAVIGLVLGYGMLALYAILVAAAVGGGIWLFSS